MPFFGLLLTAWFVTALAIYALGGGLLGVLVLGIAVGLILLAAAA